MRTPEMPRCICSGLRCPGDGLLCCSLMVHDSELGPEVLDEMLEADDLSGTRVALKDIPASDERYAVVRIKLGLYDGSLPSGMAMQTLIQLMRRDPDWPGAKELYQSASSAAFETRQSSVSHSHPPPPVERS